MTEELKDAVETEMPDEIWAVKYVSGSQAWYQKQRHPRRDSETRTKYTRSDLTAQSVHTLERQLECAVRALEFVIRTRTVDEATKILCKEALAEIGGIK